jgi:hypothetical protein
MLLWFLIAAASIGIHHALSKMGVPVASNSQQYTRQISKFLAFATAIPLLFLLSHLKELPEAKTPCAITITIAIALLTFRSILSNNKDSISIPSANNVQK